MKLFARERELTPSWSLIAPSYNLLRIHFWPVVYLSFLPGLLLVISITVLGGDGQPLTYERVRTGLLLFFAATLWTMITYPGYVYLMTEAIHGKRHSAWQAFRSGLKRFWQLVGVSLITGFAVMFGLLLLVIPGLILLRAFYLTPYYVVEQKLSPMQAVRKSISETRPVSYWIWTLLGVTLVFVIAVFIVVDIPVVGPILGLSIPYVYAFAPALRYGEISGRGKPVATFVDDHER